MEWNPGSEAMMVFQFIRGMAAADEEEISRTSQFEFRLNKVCAFPFRSGGDDDPVRFNSARDLLLVLEGLDWR
jgi:hypothetical protein